MIKHVKKFLEWLLATLEGEKGLACGEMVKLTIKCDGAASKGSHAYIYYRQPTSDEITSFKYASLEEEKSELRLLDKKDKISMQDTYKLTLKKKITPFAKKIITKVENYKRQGKDTGLDYVEKYWEDHFFLVCNAAYSQTSTLKKKGSV